MNHLNYSTLIREKKEIQLLGVDESFFYCYPVYPEEFISDDVTNIISEFPTSNFDQQNTTVRESEIEESDDELKDWPILFYL